MIENLSLRNFKVLREVDLKLQRFTLIVGPNASGKSSLLEALEYFGHHGSRSKEKQRAPEAVRSRASQGFMGMRASGSAEGIPFDFEIVFKGGQAYFDGISGIGQLARPFPPALELTVRPVMLRLDVQKLAAASYSKKVELSLPHDGEGLSSILAGLQLEQAGNFNKIVEQLKIVVPGVKNVRLKQALVGEIVGFELRFDMKGAEDIPAWAVSEGTLLTLGLLTLLGLPDAPRLVLIDELEHGLHPKALKDLVLQLRRLQEENPELQIVATSHSPYLLDHFKAEEILLTSLDDEGYAAVKPLTDHPEYERWKDLMAPGEFWSTVGESWITEGDSKKASATGR
jgi:energy-coupling factor transporter ATP-binding protein EcfA2